MDKNLLLTLNSKKYGIDVKGGEINYISHAHTDHSYALKDDAPIFCSDITASLLGLSQNGHEEKEKIKHASNCREEKIKHASTLCEQKESQKKESQNEKIKTKKYSPKRISAPKEFSFKSAGHILGSVQLIAETQEFSKLVYTGDFKLRDGLTTKGAKIEECGTLIMECTYGKPGINFPNPNEVYESMQKWHEQNKTAIQLWGGYATGKAQELIKFLNEYASIAPIVPPDVAKISQKYVQNGVKLDFLSSDTQEAKEIMRSQFCAVFPPNRLTRSFSFQIAQAHKKKTKTAIATGWTGIRNMGADACFPLSDHADFPQLLAYAKESGAKKVYLAHGKNEATAKALQKEGINAKPIEDISKKEFSQLSL
ncbi:MAG: MBL fold metallo-hydrolase [Candidatus Micrarchaeota archaeon]